jgi:tetratricopeptide (TPR) repeat protein
MTSINRPETESHQYFAALREQAREASRHGRLEGALALCEEAVRWTESHGEQADRDLALCNRSAILISCERTEGVGGQLRRILMASAVPRTRFLAAFNLTRLHQLQREVERGLFYGGLALELAGRLEPEGYLAKVHHQVGNLLLIDCRFDEACGSFEQALSYEEVEGDTERAIMLTSVGYCYVILGRHRQGFVKLFEGLRLMRRKEAGTWKMLPHLGLSYAYLDIRKLELARRHARRALDYAEVAMNRDHTMNSLYLLGEAEKLCGHELAAFECFNRLQRDFYPEQPYIAEFLMTTDVRSLIHLMA